MLKKYLRLLFSMKTAILLLILLLLACVAGSVIPQENTQSYYAGAYSEKTVHLILLMGLDDVFHSAWFIAITILLCVNLLGCNILRFPALMKRARTEYTLEKRLKAWDGTGLAVIREEPVRLFRAMRFGSIREESIDGCSYLYAVRNKAGDWGAWLTHLGMLIIIVGFAMGQMYTEKYTVYGVPGQTKKVEGTAYELTIDRFEIGLREDNTVEQYTSALTLTDTRSSETQSGQVSVNYPLSLFNMKLYQNSTGWAATVRVTKDDETIQKEVLCAGEYLEITDKPGLFVMFSAFYPDYAVDASGKPYTASGSLNHPGYLYRVFYNDRVLGMNVLSDDYISIDEYNVFFEDPQQYTLIQIKRDPFTGLVLLGGIVIMLAIILAFYVRTEEMWATRAEDGTWIIGGRSRKGGVLFTESISEKAAELNDGIRKGREER